MIIAESYFVFEIEPAFDETIKRIGGKRMPHSSPLLVRYEGENWFVECVALAEDGPRYAPRVEIGPLPELGILVRDKQVDIMHTLPPRKSTF